MLLLLGQPPVQLQLCDRIEGLESPGWQEPPCGSETQGVWEAGGLGQAPEPLRY